MRLISSRNLTIFTRLAVAASLFGCQGARGPIEHVPPYEFVPLVPGVWAAIANIGGTAAANAGIMDMGRLAIVYDTGLTPEAGRQLREAAERLTGHEVEFVINSHFHEDHIGGNQAFENASFVSTSATQRIVTAEGPERSPESVAKAASSLDAINERLETEEDPAVRKELTLMSGYLGGYVESAKEFRRVPPTVTWDHRLNFTGKARRIKIIPTGKGHSEGDAPMWIKQDSILFASDLVSTDRHPLMADSDPDGWMAALDTLLTLDFNVLVPGHGPLGDRQSVIKMKEYLRFVERAARQAQDGTPVNMIPIDSAFADWMLPSQFQENVRFVMAHRHE